MLKLQNYINRPLVFVEKTALIVCFYGNC